MAPPQRRDLGGVLEHLVPGSTQGTTHLRWPPDVFAVSAYLLKSLGAYVDVLREWPPTGARALHPPEVPWTDWAREQGKAWRAVATARTALPTSVTALWERVLATKKSPWMSPRAISMWSMRCSSWWRWRTRPRRASGSPSRDRRPYPRVVGAHRDR